MGKKGMLWGVVVLWAAVLGWGPTLTAQDKMFTYNYTFKPGSEPDGFGGIKWQTASASLDPLHTVEVIEVIWPFTYYKKNRYITARPIWKISSMSFGTASFPGSSSRSREKTNSKSSRIIVSPDLGVASGRTSMPK